MLDTPETAQQIRGRAQRLIAWHNTIIRDKQGEIIATLSSGNDIADAKSPWNTLMGEGREITDR